MRLPAPGNTPEGHPDKSGFPLRLTPQWTKSHRLPSRNRTFRFDPEVRSGGSDVPTGTASEEKRKMRHHLSPHQRGFHLQRAPWFAMEGLLSPGSGGESRTRDLVVMSHAGYHFPTPHYLITNICLQIRLSIKISISKNHVNKSSGVSRAEHQRRQTLTTRTTRT